ncbi:hypothetical protein [Azospirillum lipoferum]|uniref:Uncharacterized protein n=1 Tax=Azospirillum lipoferum (strain 4B) TaxID=862719 RepID=G7ZI08_AZOL4|nr:hypothetical protein [Azospirillum lipoferum]CBS91052.1 protein of unknown function [Azospirillum lipoferum 4B]
MSINTRLAAQAVTPPSPQPARKEKAESLDDRMSLGFDDLVDAVNPLQQLPVVSSVYREATGESISIPARLAGGFLFGGLPGLIGSAAMVAFEEVTGDTVLGHIGSLLEDEAGTAVADGKAAGPLPWMNAGTGGADGSGADPALPSPQALAEALRRKSPATETAAAALAVPAGDRPAPQLLAKLYSLEATANAGAPGVVRKAG